MKEEILYKKLKSYLTKEYMRLSNEKDAIIGEKVQLEVEKEKEEHPLFEKKDTEKIRRMFSPLSDEIYESICSLNDKNNEASKKITELENNSSNLDFSMEEMKEYISFIQKLETKWQEEQSSFVEKELFFDKEDDSVEEIEEYEESESIEEEDSNDATEMIFATAEFLEEQYPGVQFVVDFDADDYNVNSVMNANMVRVLTYTLSSTIESIEIDSVEIEIKREGEKMILSVRMLCDDEEMSHYIHKYNC